MRRIRGPLVFTVLVGAYALATLAQTLTLSPVARLVPLWVLVPVLALLAVELTLTLAPRLAARWSFLVEPDRFATRAHLARGRPTVPAEPEDAPDLRPVLAWYALLPLLVLCLDLRLALGLYTFCYLRGRAGASTGKALALAIALAGLASGVRGLLS